MEINLLARLARKATADCKQSFFGSFHLDHFNNSTECNTEKFKLSQLRLKMLL